MAQPGRLIAVVGPSGVGKDSLIDALVAAQPALVRVRRVITRPRDLGGEDYCAVSGAEFASMAAAGAFCLCWGAHDLRYGIPTSAVAAARNGTSVIANLSRGALAEAKAVFPAVLALNVTAAPETLARRLATRGRETPEAIARRLARSGAPVPGNVPGVTINNDGPLQETVRAALAALSLADAEQG